jgi:hypothetical protein
MTTLKKPHERANKKKNAKRILNKMSSPRIPPKAINRTMELQYYNENLILDVQRAMGEEKTDLLVLSYPDLQPALLF